MIERILVALDGSPRATAVVEAATEIGRKFQAVLVPFRAILVPPDIPPAGHLLAGDLLAEHLEQVAVESMSRLLANCGVACKPPIVAQGQPWRAILKAADEHDVDLIVLGSHGYHGIDRVLGTTAGKVANLSRRNVLVVHERQAAGEPSRVSGST